PEAVAVWVDARVAGVAHAVAVRVALRRVRGQRAAVAGVAEPVVVGVALIGVPRVGAIVGRASVGREAGIAEPVAVAIGAGIGRVVDVVAVVVAIDGHDVDPVVGRLEAGVLLRRPRLAVVRDDAVHPVVVRAVEAEADLRARDRSAHDLVVVRHADPAGIVDVVLVRVALEDEARALDHVPGEDVVRRIAAHVDDRAAHDVVRVAGVLVIDRGRSRGLDRVAPHDAVVAPHDVEPLLAVPDDLVVDDLRAHAPRADVDAVLLVAFHPVLDDPVIDRLPALRRSGDLDADRVALGDVALEEDALSPAHPDAALEAAHLAVLDLNVADAIDLDAGLGVLRAAPADLVSRAIEHGAARHAEADAAAVDDVGGQPDVAPHGRVAPAGDPVPARGALAAPGGRRGQQSRGHEDGDERPRACGARACTRFRRDPLHRTAFGA